MSSTPPTSRKTSEPTRAAPPVSADRPERPLGIRLLIWLFWFWGGALLLLCLGVALGDGPIILGGRPVPRAEALPMVLPALAPMALAVVGAALAVGFARPWGRAAALFPFALAAFAPSLTGMADPSAGELLLALLMATPVIAALVWYLYFRPGPRAYFAAGRGA